MDIHQEVMEATVHSIVFELEEAITHWVEDVLLCVNQETQGLSEELMGMFHETGVHKDVHQYVIKELSLMIEGETQLTNPLMDKMLRELSTKLVEIKAWAESGRGTWNRCRHSEVTEVWWGYIMGCVSSSRLTEYNCWTHLEESTCLITALQDQATGCATQSPERRDL